MSEDRARRVRAISDKLFSSMSASARLVGWSVAVHGSRSRDLDVVAVPWTEEAVDAYTFLEVMRNTTADTLHCGAVISSESMTGRRLPTIKPHGRRSFVITFIPKRDGQLVEDEQGAHPYIDLSVMDVRMLTQGEPQ